MLIIDITFFYELINNILDIIKVFNEILHFICSTFNSYSYLLVPKVI